ncbi:hypothetical protein Vadar_028583 [Vaccinium darrowii]|uniref:Uncharacterized protein n=1 Tax=Vaccinium darrowii TaxID=229202 RepID=A0ACB7Z6Q7_9ERIC|nr:hypothetical protein Vadar_028583 [Vaccinium darrowii]
MLKTLCSPTCISREGSPLIEIDLIYQSKTEFDELRVGNSRISIACAGPLVKSNQNGVFRNDPNFRGDWNHFCSLCQNLLQQRAFYESVARDIGYYCNSMLLDDVGNCVSCPDEATHSPNFE